MKLTHNIENSISYKIFVTVFLLIAVHASPDGPQNGRYLNSVRSLVEFGTFALQKGYIPHVDTVEIGGNLYSAIPPGIPLILAPLYFIYRAIALLFKLHSSELYWPIFSILTIILVMAPLGGLIAVIMFKILSKFTDNLVKKLWLVFVLIFGSLIFFYSTYGIWSHCYTVFFTFAAFYSLLANKNSFWIGLCLGLAELCDYEATAANPLIIGFWFYIYLTRKREILKKYKIFSRELLLLLLGYGFCISILLYYNYTITGSIFESPNSLFKAPPAFSFPSLGRIFTLLFGLSKGIFLYFPMTLLFAYSLFRSAIKKDNIVVFCYLYVIFIFCFDFSFTKELYLFGFGPRGLIIALPFMLIPIVYCPLKYIKIFGILSIFINLAGVSTIPSDNLLKNIGLFLGRGPFPQWLIYLHKTILPKYFNIELSVVTPFFIYVVMALVIYSIWTPREKRWTWLTQDTCTTKVLSQRHSE